MKNFPRARNWPPQIACFVQPTVLNHKTHIWQRKLANYIDWKVTQSSKKVRTAWEYLLFLVGSHLKKTSTHLFLCQANHAFSTRLNTESKPALVYSGLRYKRKFFPFPCSLVCACSCHWLIWYSKARAEVCTVEETMIWTHANQKRMGRRGLEW